MIATRTNLILSLEVSKRLILLLKAQLNLHLLLFKLKELETFAVTTMNSIHHQVLEAWWQRRQISLISIRRMHQHIVHLGLPYVVLHKVLSVYLTQVIEMLLDLLVLLIQLHFSLEVLVVAAVDNLLHNVILHHIRTISPATIRHLFACLSTLLIHHLLHLALNIGIIHLQLYLPDVQWHHIFISIPLRHI